MEKEIVVKNRRGSRKARVSVRESDRGNLVIGTRVPKNKKQGKKKNMNKNKRNLARARASQFRLSSCADGYLHVIANPFDMEGDFCIPDEWEIPSKKIKCLDRGYITAGAGGLGFLIASPKGATNSSVCQSVTVGSYAKNFVSFLATDGVLGTAVSQFPYSSTDMTGGNLAVRLVACGMKVRYIGTELNRSGQLVIVRLPNANSALNTFNGKTASQLASIQGSVTRPVVKRWEGLFFVPMESDDFDYITSDSAIDNAGRAATMGIFWSGGAPDTQMEFEIVRFYEVIARNGFSIDNVTKSDSDTVGLSAVKNAVTNNVVTPSEGTYQKFLSYIGSYTTSDISGYVDVAGKVITTAAAARRVI